MCPIADDKGIIFFFFPPHVGGGLTTTIYTKSTITEVSFADCWLNWKIRYLVVRPWVPCTKEQAKLQRLFLFSKKFAWNGKFSFKKFSLWKMCWHWYHRKFNFTWDSSNGIFLPLLVPTVWPSRSHFHEQISHFADKIMAISLHFLIGRYKTSYLECS